MRGIAHQLFRLSLRSRLALALLCLLPAAASAQPEGWEFKEDFRRERQRLESQQPKLAPAELDRSANAFARSNELARAAVKAIISNDFTNAARLLREFPGTADDLRSGFGPTLVHIAVHQNAEAQLKFLLEHKANPDRSDSPGEVPLLLALRLQRWSMALSLIQAGANVNLTDYYGQTPLETLLECAWPTEGETDLRYKLLRQFLEKGANPFAPARSQPPLSVVESLFNRSGLEWGDAACDLLLTNQPRALRRTPRGDTALHVATQWGRTNALAALLASGLSLNQTNDAGITPLQSLAESGLAQPGQWDPVSFGSRGRMALMGPRRRVPGPKLTPAPTAPQVLDFLLTHGATLDLLSAAGLGRTNELASLLADRSLARARDGAGRTALHYAARTQPPQVTRMLLLAGADPSLPSLRPVPQPGLAPPLPAGITPLHLAVLRDNSELVRWLLRAGAPVSPQDEAGDTPLHLVARSRQTNCAALLIAAHAALDLTNHASQTPLQLAATVGCDVNLERLLKAGANLTNGLRNTTLLHLAAENGNAPAVRILLRHGLALDARDEQGHTPFQRALVTRRWDILNLLQSKGANVNEQDIHGDAPLHFAAALQDDVVSYPAQQSLWIKWKTQWLAAPGWRKQTLSSLVKWKVLSAPPGSALTSTSLTAWLLHCGAKPNVTNAMGQTPLHVLCGLPWFAYPFGHVSNRLETLLSAGAQLDRRDTNGLTCVHIAASVAPPSLLAQLARHVKPTEPPTDFQGRSPAHYAARYGTSDDDRDRAARLAALLAGGFSPNTPDAQGRTPLHEAVATYPGRWSWWRVALLDVLFTNRADANAQDAQGSSPLHEAMRTSASNPDYGVEQVSLVLLTNHAQPNLRDRQGRTSLHLLAAQPIQRPHPTDRLLPLLREYPWDFVARDHTGQTPLHLFAANLDSECNDCLEVFRHTLTNAALPNLTNGLGDTPLHAAARAGQRYALKLLFSAGADPALRNHRGETALYLAAQQAENSSRTPMLMPVGARESFLGSIYANDQRAFKLWLDADTNVCSLTNREGLTALRIATDWGRTNFAQRLLELGAPLDPLSAVRLGDEQELPKLLAAHPGPVPAQWLLEAVRLNRIEAAHLLVAAGANVNALDDQGQSLAYCARAAQAPQLEQWLRAQGCRDTLFDAIALPDRALLEQLLAATPASVNATNGQGHTPLLVAVGAQRYDLAALLLAHGASIKSRTPEGWTALHLAAANDAPQTGKRLLDAGANPNELAGGGIGPLHLAACLGRTNFAALLLAHGADVNLCPPAGGPSLRNTPLHWAASYGGPEMVKLLLAHGADPEAVNNAGARPIAGIGPDHHVLTRANFPCPGGAYWLPQRKLSEAEKADIHQLLTAAATQPPAPKPSTH